MNLEVQIMCAKLVHQGITTHYRVRGFAPDVAKANMDLGVQRPLNHPGAQVVRPENITMILRRKTSMVVKIVQLVATRI